MDFTNDQRHENYLMLQRSLQEIRSGRPITDDWEHKHYAFFEKTRSFFFNFNCVTNKDDNEELTKTCAELEKLAVYTEQFIEKTGRMDYAVYKLFLERLLYLAEYTMEDDEINSLMENLGL